MRRSALAFIVFHIKITTHTHTYPSSARPIGGIGLEKWYVCFCKRPSRRPSLTLRFNQIGIVLFEKYLNFRKTIWYCTPPSILSQFVRVPSESFFSNLLLFFWILNVIDFAFYLPIIVTLCPRSATNCRCVSKIKYIYAYALVPVSRFPMVKKAYCVHVVYTIFKDRKSFNILNIIWKKMTDVYKLRYWLYIIVHERVIIRDRIFRWNIQLNSDYIVKIGSLNVYAKYVFNTSVVSVHAHHYYYLYDHERCVFFSFLCPVPDAPVRFYSFFRLNTKLQFLFNSTLLMEMRFTRPIAVCRLIIYRRCVWNLGIIIKMNIW